MKIVTIARLLLIFLVISSMSVKAAEPHTFTFGFVPQQAASKLARLWSPLLSYIEKEADIKLIFDTAPNIPKFEKRLAKGDYDFAYMNPYHYTVYHEVSGYTAIVKQKDKKITGIVVVHKDSQLNSISDLQLKPMAFPAPAAFAATVLPTATFSKLGISVVPSYVKSHDSVYRAVAKKHYIAGGGIERTFNSVEPSIRDQLKILWKTEKFTPHAFAVLPHVPMNVVDLVSSAMINMENSESTRSILSSLNMKGFSSATDKDWDDVRRLQINLLR